MPHFTSNYTRAESGQHWKLLSQPPVELKPDTRDEVRIAVDPRPSDNESDADLKEIKAALTELNYAFKKPTKSQALKFYHRAQRGLLSYEALPTDELRQFVAQRGLKSLASTKGRFGQIKNRPALLQRLHKADDDLTFDRFADLPEEIMASKCTRPSVLHEKKAD